ncbi:hypothetical protein ACF3NF_07155 [Anaerococcus martiniensis]
MNNKCIINMTFADELVFSCLCYSIFAYIKKLKFPEVLILHA